MTTPAGVYVHFPWCERRCPYCDFATRAEKPDAIPQTRYTNAVLQEIELRRATGQLDSGHTSVFFGGGTPSLWEPGELARVFKSLDGAADIECTIECNPASLHEERVEAFMQAGINRFSIGTQSLHNEHLKFLGRLHNRQGAIAAISAATKYCERVSADLIFGMPNQTWDELRADVDTLLALGVEHISAYALTIEPQTQFGLLHKKGLLKVSSDDRYATLYDALRDYLEKQGLLHYEVSNYAKPGASSQHNQGYWRAQPYVGLGAAAVGCTRTQHGVYRRTKNRIASDRYLQSLETKTNLEDLADESEDLDNETRARESIMLGLRTNEGADLSRIKTETGIDYQQTHKTVLNQLQEEKRITLTDSTLSVPQEHWFRLDSIVMKFF